jgi:uncharacterized Rmd1/YagE family protein
MEERVKELEHRMGLAENRVSVVETKVDSVKDDIKEIKDFQSKIMLWLIGLMGTSVVTLLTVILNMMRK